MVSSFAGVPMVSFFYTDGQAQIGLGLGRVKAVLVRGYGGSLDVALIFHE